MAQADGKATDMNIAESVTDLIGETPLLRIEPFADNLIGKIEAGNPYSVKDRIAREIIRAAEEDGALEPGGTVVEATSGNTGIGLASVSSARGYDCVLTMPASMSQERWALLRALGADVELTPAEEGMAGANRRAEAIVADREGAIMARQFENEANPAAHRRTTGPEIWADTNGEVDALVAGVGTGGTITGVSAHIKQDRGQDEFTAVAVEPAESPTVSAQCSAGHEIQGIGPGFLPKVLRTDLIDEIRAVDAETAKESTRKTARTVGFLVGISSGAALAAASDYARGYPEELVVVMLPDTGERYLSTDLFTPE